MTSKLGRPAFGDGRLTEGAGFAGEGGGEDAGAVDELVGVGGVGCYVGAEGGGVGGGCAG